MEYVILVIAIAFIAVFMVGRHQKDVEDIDMSGTMEKGDKLKGGLADKKKPSDFDSKQLRIGTNVEMEHTKDRQIAKEIAKDHLSEDPNYYEKIKKIEKTKK